MLKNILLTFLFSASTVWANPCDNLPNFPEQQESDSFLSAVIYYQWALCTISSGDKLMNLREVVTANDFEDVVGESLDLLEHSEENLAKYCDYPDLSKGVTRSQRKKLADKIIKLRHYLIKATKAGALAYWAGDRVLRTYNFNPKTGLKYDYEWLIK